jgi:hypothetical protein
MGMRGISGAQGVDTLTAPSAERNALRAGSIPRADALGSGSGRHKPPTYATFASLRKTFVSYSPSEVPHCRRMADAPNGATHLV